MADRRTFVFLASDFRPMTGGVAEYMHALADALAAADPVTVMSSVPPDGAEWAHAYRLTLLPPWPARRLGERAGDRFAPVRKIHTGAYFAGLRRCAQVAVARIRAEIPEPRAVLIPIWGTEAHFWCEACRRASVPYHLFAQGVEILVPLYGRLPQWRARDFAAAAGVIANSRATADLARARFSLPQLPAVVHPPAGPRPPQALVTRRAAELRAAIGIGSGPVVLTVARLVPRKGVDLLVRSVAALASEFPGLRYVVAGDGPERAAVAALARELGLEGSVHLLGAVDDLTKWAAYELCDVFAMPNRLLGGTNWEGFGIVFVEAALAGRASIGGRTGGTADAILDGVTGVLVDPENSEELIGALRSLLSDPDRRRRLGEAGAERARRDFTGLAAAVRLRHAIESTVA
jgi:phosphatidylinositol alpha-1,6-mannosyltransferase